MSRVCSHDARVRRIRGSDADVRQDVVERHRLPFGPGEDAGDGERREHGAECDGAQRPTRAQVWRGRGFEARCEAFDLQPLERRQLLRLREQQIGAVLEIGATRIEFADQPGVIEATHAMSHERSRRDDGERGHESRDETAAESPCQDRRQRDPRQTGERDIEAATNARVVQQPVQAARSTHGTTPRRGRVAIQRSIANTSRINSINHGAMSRGDGGNAAAPVVGA